MGHVRGIKMRLECFKIFLGTKSLELVHTLQYTTIEVCVVTVVYAVVDKGTKPSSGLMRPTAERPT